MLTEAMFTGAYVDTKYKEPVYKASTGQRDYYTNRHKDVIAQREFSASEIRSLNAPRQQLLRYSTSYIPIVVHQ